MSPRTLTTALAVLLGGCHRAPLPSPDPAPSASTTPVAAAAEVATVAPLAPLGWAPLADPGSIGMPAGCQLRLPVRRAAPPRGHARFLVPAGSAALVLAVDEDGDGAVDRNGVLDEQGKPGRSVPWTTLDAPPLLGRSSSGWIAVDVEDTGKGIRRSVLWREGAPLEPLVEGERLDVTDAACSGATCAVLSTLASASAGPGATLLVGDPAMPPSRCSSI